MKIAVISDHIPTRWAHSINTLRHANAFYEMGNEVDIIVIQSVWDRKERLKIKDIHEFYGLNKNIKIKFFKDFSPYYWRGVRFFKPFASSLEKILEQLNYVERQISTLCRRNNYNLTYCRRASNVAYYNILSKIPTVVESHHYNIPIELKRVFKLGKNPYLKAVITISKELVNNHLKAGIPKEKLLILEDAVELNKFISITQDKSELRNQLRLPVNKTILVYVGNLREGRGIDVILKAAGNIKEKDLVFLIIGGSDERIKYWERFINSNNISADIKFLGFKEHKKIPFYLKSADVLLAPYSNRCDTVKWMSPIKLFEYMASKVPIIASDVQRIKEICNNDECLLFETDNYQSLSEKIEFLLTNKTLKNDLVLKAFEKVKDFTYIKRCERILETTKR